MPNLVFAIPLFRGDVEKTPDIFEVFYTCAVNDSFEREYSFQDNPRQVALETITEQYFSHPQTLPLLRDRDANDPDEQVREFAKKKLAELG
ncbi:MAG TPA: hypothetical protein VE944_10610 [Nostoc sp.]|uniref:hypothetical protein n=1 Tax=Nostoc sp. TaxID=1180 RepID=UPI002D365FEB|nr:hypothetical protein [Nostoc sp.]HYX14800.1 hypothetical protein [Nostoc sp.]